jgi:lysozyme
MNISTAGRDFVKVREGSKCVAYQDVVGIWTCGVGHTGPDVVPGMTASDEQVDEWLDQDLAMAEACVNANVTVPINQSQFDALCSFVFNLGCGALRGSTLLKKLNAGNHAGAANEFLHWDHAGGRQVPGLTTRRKAEYAMFTQATSNGLAQA